MHMIESVIQDLRYGARMLARNARFTGLAVFVLALGIGVNTTVFTAYKALVARPLDARDPGRMVNLGLIRQSGATDVKFSVPDYEAYRDSVRSFAGLLAHSTEHVVLSNAGQRVSQADSLFGRMGLLRRSATNAEMASAFVVSENYFGVLGVAPIRGRSFGAMTAAELAASPSVLISENYWQSRFGGDPAVLGKTVRLNGAAFTIIGITPHDFVGVSILAPDFWIPLHLEPLAHPAHNWLKDREYGCCQLFARLADGVNANQAQAEMNAVAERLRAQHDARSDASKPVSVLVWRGSPFPLPLNRYGGLEFAIALIMCAAGMVMAVACANVGSLQLARARKRVNEIGTRLSLGASRGRVVRQLLTESTLLGLLSGVVALVLTSWFTRALATRFAEAWPTGNGAVVFHVTPDAGVLVYVFAISLAAGAAFGLLPALENSRSALATAFKANAGTSSVRSRRLQNLLVGIQVSASLALMVSGSMFVRSAIRSLEMETGYDSRHVIDLELQFPESYRDNHARKAAVAAELRARLAAIPGVAQITSASPPGAPHRRVTSVIADRSRPVQSPLYVSEVQANYFETLGIPLFLGRGLPSQSVEGCAVVSES